MNSRKLILPSKFGLEIECAGQFESGLPACTIDDMPLVEALLTHMDPKIYTQIEKIGGVKEEVFKHQREMFTHPGAIADVLDKAICLHQIIAEQMKTLFGVHIASGSGPLLFPGGGSELLTERSFYKKSMKKVNSKGQLMQFVTPRAYYTDAISDIADTQPDNFAIARNASTSSTHLHMSCETPINTLQLCYSLIAHCSKSMIENTSHWWQERGMTPERFDARSQIVDIRSALGEVSDPFNSILLPTPQKNNRQDRMMNRYFPSGDMNVAPTSDHTPVVIKKPSSLTTEIRTADGPGSDPENIKKIIDIYQEHILRAHELFTSL